MKSCVAIAMEAIQRIMKSSGAIFLRILTIKTTNPATDRQLTEKRILGIQKLSISVICEFHFLGIQHCFIFVWSLYADISDFTYIGGGPNCYFFFLVVPFEIIEDVKASPWNKIFCLLPRFWFWYINNIYKLHANESNLNFTVVET